ncbi:MAG: hypothetical protein NVS1B6_06100 [Steroidobacteraceae bacterium]
MQRDMAIDVHLYRMLGLRPANGYRAQRKHQDTGQVITIRQAA